MKANQSNIFVAVIAYCLGGLLQNVHAQACQIILPEITVTATSHQNLGGIEPSNLVALGTRVRLFGIAQSQSLTPQCVLIKDQIPFSWSLRFQARGKAPIDLKLSNADTLQPEFNADEAGTYTAELDAADQVAMVRVETIAPMGWFSIGPNGDENGTADVGRVNTLAFDATSGLLYAGSALGGVFLSRDGGQTWSPMTDHKGLPTIGIGALAVGVDGAVYAATGDSHSNDRAFPAPAGAGIWKSVDAGVTWNPAGSTLAENCPKGSVAFDGNSTRIITHPKVAGILYVAGNQGVLRSSNGGGCWQRILSGMTTDLAMDPSAPATIYVAAPGQQSLLLKTTNAEDPTPVFQSLPIPINDNYSYGVLAVAQNTPTTIYAAFATDQRTDFIRSDNAGASWNQGPSEQCSGQCAYDMALAVSPLDADRVVYGHVSPIQSITGMRSPWSDLHSVGVHSDFHAMVFAPQDGNILYAANDGGVFMITLAPKDSLNLGTGWASRNLGLDITQAPDLAIAPAEPQVSSLGAWDNGSQRRLGGRVWGKIGSGDGFYAAIDASPQLTYYYSGNALFNGNIARFVQAGVDIGSSNGFWSNPYKQGELMGSSANGRIGAKFYLSANADTAQQLDWRCADPDPDPANQNNAWDVEFAPNGRYYITHTDGSIWSFTLRQDMAITDCGPNQTNALNAVKVFQAPKAAFIRISLDPLNVNNLYAVVAGAVDGARVIHLTQSQGQWTANPLAGVAGQPGALPGVAFSKGIIADSFAGGLLYVGTDHGLWRGVQQDDGGYEWALDVDIPDTWITDIVAHRNQKGFGNTLRLSTYGRGLWERLPQRQPLGGASVKQPAWCFNCEPYVPDRPERIGRPVVMDHAAWLSVPYTYVAPVGSTATLAVTPLQNGIDQPFFLADTQRIEPGSSLAQIQIVYSGANAPLGLHTDGLRVTITPESSGPQLPDGGGRNGAAGPVREQVSILPFDKWWLRPEARLLTVDAQRIEAGSLSVRSFVVIRSSAGRTRGFTPLSIPVRNNSRVTARILTRGRGDEGTSPLQAWTTNGVLGSSQSTTTIKVNRTTKLVAHLRSREPQTSPCVFSWRVNQKRQE